MRQRWREAGREGRAHFPQRPNIILRVASLLGEREEPAHRHVNPQSDSSAGVKSRGSCPSPLSPHFAVHTHTCALTHRLCGKGRCHSLRRTVPARLHPTFNTGLDLQEFCLAVRRCTMLLCCIEEVSGKGHVLHSP